MYTNDEITKSHLCLLSRHLIRLGVNPISGPRCGVYVILEGAVIGTVPAKRCEQIATALRYLKINGQIPSSTEVCII